MYCKGTAADMHCTLWVLWHLPGYARGWSSLSNCDWLPSSETVNLMLQWKYSLMFSFALCSFAFMSTSPLNARLLPAWPMTSTLFPNFCSHARMFSHPVIISTLRLLITASHHSPPLSTVPTGMGLEISHASLSTFSLPSSTSSLSQSSVGVWCLSEPVKTALILITPAALLPCSIALLRQSPHNHFLQAVLSKGRERAVKYLRDWNNVSRILEYFLEYETINLTVTHCYYLTAVFKTTYLPWWSLITRFTNT